MQSTTNYSKFRNVIVYKLMVNDVEYINIDHLIEQLMFINKMSILDIEAPEFDTERAKIEAINFRTKAITTFINIFKTKAGYNYFKDVSDKLSDDPNHQLLPYDETIATRVRSLVRRTKAVHVVDEVNDNQTYPVGYYVVRQIADYVLLKLDKQYYVIIMKLLNAKHKAGDVELPQIHVPTTKEIRQAMRESLRFFDTDSSEYKDARARADRLLNIYNVMNLIKNCKYTLTEDLKEDIKKLLRLVLTSEYKRYLVIKAIDVCKHKHVSIRDKNIMLNMISRGHTKKVLTLEEFCIQNKLDTIDGILSYIQSSFITNVLQ